MHRWRRGAAGNVPSRTSAGSPADELKEEGYPHAVSGKLVYVAAVEPGRAFSMGIESYKIYRPVNFPEVGGCSAWLGREGLAGIFSSWSAKDAVDEGGV